MIRASAHYLAIVIAMVISVICSALILAAYLYFAQYRAKFRADRLQNNIRSGVNILLVSRDSIYYQGRAFSLFETQEDSVILKKQSWGLYDVCTVKAFIQSDTMKRAFTTANNIDSSKWAALYLIDEDRPVSFSGNTSVRGDAYLPKAGIRAAYVDNEAYTGDKRFVSGRVVESVKKLPELDNKRLKLIEKGLDETDKIPNSNLRSDSLENSFFNPTIIINLGKQLATLRNMTLKGNIILRSDTTLLIDSTASLKDILVYAKGIRINSGFNGTCQLFASDSISIARDCKFGYPSCIGVTRFREPVVTLSPLIKIGERSMVNGFVFVYEKYPRSVKSMITLEKKAKITGQIYAQGIMNLRKGSVIYGSVFASRFLYQSEFSMYENYLINATINSDSLSSYYQVPDLSPVASGQKKILQWLEPR